MNNEPMTLQEIAKIEGISHQAVDEIIRRALKKVKAALDSKGLTLADLAWD